MMQRSISGYFVEGRLPSDVVAFGGKSVIDVAQFQRDIAWNAARLRRVDCRRGWVAAADTYWGAVGILALFHAKAGVAMPPTHRLDGLVEDMQLGDLIVTDRQLAGIDDVLVLEPAPRDIGQLNLALPGALDVDRCRIDLFTSGSTAKPKRVGKSLRQLECEAQVIEAFFAPQLPLATRIHATVPYQHLYGLTFGLIWPLLAGRPFNRQSHEIWETVFASALDEAVLISSPAHLTRLGGFSPIDDKQRPALILSAGAALPATAVADVATVLRQIPMEIFGSTETGAIASRSWEEIDAPWLPLPGVVVEQSVEGLLSVRSPFIAGGGPFMGEDRIAVQSDGRFRALGRVDDICKIEGKRISLSTVEHHLKQLPEIAEVAVLVLDGDWPRLGAVVKLQPRGQQELDKLGSYRFAQYLRRCLSRRLETAGLPKRWRFVAELPKQPLGKRRIADLQALFSDPAAPRAATWGEPEVRGNRPSVAAAGSPRLELDLYIDPNLPQLDGHFPDLPIVPGVALVDWATMFAARHLNIGDGIARSLQVKFRRLIMPGEIVTLVLEHQIDRNRLAFSYQQRAQICATGSFPVERS
jgi:acyl-coenzyme A synthetase/AMP-(fatty) acid ligase